MRKYNNKSNISGKLIEKFRIKKNLSREELAEQLQLIGLNVERGFIYKIETQNKLLKDFELIAICKILGITMEDLEKELN